MFDRISISVVAELTDTSSITVIMTVTDMIVTTVANAFCVNITFDLDHTVTDTVVTVQYL